MWVGYGTLRLSHLKKWRGHIPRVPYQIVPMQESTYKQQPNTKKI